MMYSTSSVHGHTQSKKYTFLTCKATLPPLMISNIEPFSGKLSDERLPFVFPADDAAVFLFFED